VSLHQLICPARAEIRRNWELSGVSCLDLGASFGHRIPLR
jgi:hypothetical protein